MLKRDCQVIIEKTKRMKKDKKSTEKSYEYEKLMNDTQEWSSGSLI